MAFKSYFQNLKKSYQVVFEKKLKITTTRTPRQGRSYSGGAAKNKKKKLKKWGSHQHWLDWRCCRKFQAERHWNGICHSQKSDGSKVWNSPMRELIGSVMVSSPLLLTFGTLSLLLYFRLPLTFLPSKGRSITTLGTRCHDFLFVLLLFLDILQLFYSLHYTSFPFLKGCRLEKGHIVPVLCSHS